MHTFTRGYLPSYGILNTLWFHQTWLENPRTEWRFLARKSLISMIHFPLPCFSTGGYRKQRRTQMIVTYCDRGFVLNIPSVSTGKVWEQVSASWHWDIRTVLKLRLKLHAGREDKSLPKGSVRCQHISKRCAIV